MDDKRKAAIHLVRQTAASKNAAEDAIQILSVISGDRPPSIRRLFSYSSSSSSSSSLVIDNAQNSDVLNAVAPRSIPRKPSSMVHHRLKSIAASKNASNDVMEFLPGAKPTPSFRWLFPRFRSRSSSSSSSLSCASFSSYHTCTQDEDVLNTDGDAKGSQIPDSGSDSSSSSLLTLVEVDDTSSSVTTNKEIKAVKKSASIFDMFVLVGEYEHTPAKLVGGIKKNSSQYPDLNQPVARQRGWLEGRRKAYMLDNLIAIGIFLKGQEAELE